LSIMDNMTGNGGLLGSGGIMGTISKKLESVRPHILGEIDMKSLGSGSLLSGGNAEGFLTGSTGILTVRSNAFRSRIKGLQTAPTIMDKVKSLLNPPGTPVAGSSSATPPSGDLERQYYQENPTLPAGPPGITTIPTDVSFH
jgi:hypothetical protein